MSNKIPGSKALLEALLHEGVDTIFGYPGGAVIPIFDTLYDYFDKLKYILTRHEQGASHSAEGYARVSGKPGVCIVTSGPAATNMITGIGDANIDSTPIVVITGQVGSSLLGSDAFQEIDVVGITQPITKWSYQIRKPEEIAWAVARAFYIASSGRPGPVVLDITKDAQINSVDFKAEICDYIRSYRPNLPLHTGEVGKASALIDAAKKPFALIGHGVTIGKAEEELKEFLEKAEIPAAWTMLGESALPTAHYLNKGMLGMHGNIGPNIKTNECDLLISIGMRFDDRITGDLNQYAKQAKVIHFDIDPSEINKNVKTNAAIVGDVKLSLPVVTELIRPAKHSEWLKSFDPYEEKEHKSVMENELYPKEGPIKMGETVRKISDACKQDAILVTDVGQNQMSAIRYFQFKKKRSVVTSGGLGTMGFGIPAAIGAKVAIPNRTVCMFSGDGGFQMTIQELGTIIQENLGVKMILMNNNHLGMVRQWQEMFYKERYSSTEMMYNPDFIAIAKAYGINGQKVDERKDLDAAIQEMLKDDAPYLLVVNVEEKGMIFPMVPSGGNVSNIMTGE